MITMIYRRNFGVLSLVRVLRHNSSNRAARRSPTNITPFRRGQFLLWGLGRIGFPERRLLWSQRSWRWWIRDTSSNIVGRNSHPHIFRVSGR